MKNTPKRDGSGQGTRANKGRGGYAKPRQDNPRRGNPRREGRLSRIRRRWLERFKK